MADNTVALVKTTKACGVSVVLGSLVSGTFRGRTYPRLLELLTATSLVQRTQINCWDDTTFVAQMKAFNKGRLLIAGLWTEAGVSFAALAALELGCDVYVVTDACAGMSTMTHETAIQRMV